MHMNIDCVLVEKIVNEVKSQGVFDKFRKDSMADVDTKPAYQNLRQRVETTVSKFLSEQTWKQDLNKNQLREKLRKHITEAGFLDTGVERIVDQVVNPKISAVFQPKIEDIAYKYLGIEKPIPAPYKENSLLNGKLEVKTDLLPTDLEAVSPDSEKATTKSESKEDLFNDSEDKNEEFESPPFEPIEGGAPSPIKKEDSNHSQLSGISGLTSQDSLSDDHNKSNSEKIGDPGQESELSQVSSNSRLSIVTNDEDTKGNIKERNSVDISEEAQMPKFNENYNSGDISQQLHFDIKKEEIKFEGTSWKLEKHDEQYETMPQDEYLTTNQNIKTENDIQKTDSLKIDDAYSNSASTKTSNTQESCEHKSEKETDTSESNNSFLSKSLSINENSKNESEKSSPSNHTNKDEKYKKSSQKRRHTSSNGKNETSKSETTPDADKNDTKNVTNSSKSHSNSSSSRGESDRRRSSSSKHKSSKSSSDLSQSKNDKRRKLEKEKERKKKDDHSSAKLKERRRKSTDSNDGDSNKETCRSAPFIEKATHTNKSTNDYNSATNISNNSNSSGASCSEEFQSTSCRHGPSTSKPTILDDFLQKSSAHNVEISSKSKTTVSVKTSQDVPLKPSKSKISPDDEPLKYFEVTEAELKHTEELLNKLQNIIDKSVKANKNIYLYDCEEDIKNEFQNISQDVVDLNCTAENTEEQIKNKNPTCPDNDSVDTSHNSNLKKDLKKNQDSIAKVNESKNKSKDRTHTQDRKRRANDHYTVSYQMLTDRSSFKNNGDLVINCLDYDNISNFSKLNNKLYKTIDAAIICPEISPSSSELSVSSKENEFIGKLEKDLSKCKTNDNMKEKVSSERSSTGMKTSQRYSSEDLYKPRPILGQRSRRRALNTDVI